jgi:hypothetical protein
MAGGPGAPLAADSSGGIRMDAERGTQMRICREKFVRERAKTPAPSSHTTQAKVRLWGRPLAWGRLSPTSARAQACQPAF